MKRLCFIVILCSIMASVSSVAAREQAQIDKRQISLSWGTDKVKLYEHEPVLLTLYLRTPELDVRGVKETKACRLDKGNFSYMSGASFDSRGHMEEKDGRRWYVYPVACYAMALDRPGKYKLGGGSYAVDIAIPVIYNDPFWGKIQSVEVERIEVPVKEVEFKVSALPDNRGDSEFSGAVGNFSVDVTVPPGDIYLNEEAIALITVKGEGWLSENVLPEYRGAFGNNVRLKSFSENRRHYVENGHMMSELQLECSIIPSSRENAVIGPVKIEFFNPASGLYETAESEPVKVTVKSIAGKSPALDI